MADMKQAWIAEAFAALSFAYVPYSKFPVAAVLITKEGNLYKGVNIENASYGLSNCAERTAIFKAVSEGEKQFAHLVVVGKTTSPIAPCGACRQVLAEFCSPDLPVTLVGTNGTIKETTVSELLPYAFSGNEIQF